MSIRKRKPFKIGRNVRNISAQKIQKLEEIKQQLLELDNRLKMEMVGLRELSGQPLELNNEPPDFSNLLQSCSFDLVCFLHDSIFYLFHLEACKTSVE